ncbi:MAG: hypothetical protein IIY84_00060 [Eubacterium sp.]|nr:hypothetical protein [Eubacterium sp.]
MENRKPFPGEPKEIVLIPDIPYTYKVDVDVCDLPVPGGKPRKRCRVTVDFLPGDIEEMKGRGMSEEEILAHYDAYLYDLVRSSLVSEWTCVSGREEVLDIVRKGAFRV